ncbi:MAG: response regulator transcription factor [Bacteroidales bacterium]|nr:response regulator transcription factor [Bacteroidales bacterium]
MYNNLKCVLIDDEKDALDGLEILLNAIGNIQIAEKIGDSENAACRVSEILPDVVFLDIDMPLKNGFEVLEEIKKMNINTKVVFVTAYNQYILKALRNSAFDYLTKPVDRLELKDVINRILNDNFSENQSSNLNSLKMMKIPIINGCVFIKNDDIIYLEADGNYTNIHTTEGTEISSLNLGKFEQKLIGENFLRISKSLLINVLYLNRFDKKNKKCCLKTEEKTFELTVSRRNLGVFDNFI